MGYSLGRAVEKLWDENARQRCQGRILEPEGRVLVELAPRDFFQAAELTLMSRMRETKRQWKAQVLIMRVRAI